MQSVRDRCLSKTVLHGSMARYMKKRIRCFEGKVTEAIQLYSIQAGMCARIRETGGTDEKI